MSKYLIPDKRILTGALSTSPILLRVKPLVIVVFALALSKEAPAKQTVQLKVFSESIRKAGMLLSEGSRREAFLKLEQLRVIFKSRPEQIRIQKKKQLFMEQFLFTESFQGFASAKTLAEAELWTDCLRELDQLKQGDQENLLVLRLKAQCSFRADAYLLSKKVAETILQYIPKDEEILLLLAHIALAEKQYIKSLELLETVDFRASSHIERKAILKAEVYEYTDRISLAIETLKQDIESHLDHVEALYQIGRLYSKISGQEWLTRKYLALFLSRCKRMNLEEAKSRSLKNAVVKAQDLFTAVEKKLNL